MTEDETKRGIGLLEAAVGAVLIGLIMLHALNMGVAFAHALAESWARPAAELGASAADAWPLEAVRWPREAPPRIVRYRPGQATPHWPGRVSALPGQVALHWPGRVVEPPASPEAVARQFYEWYLGHASRPSTGQGSPLMDGSYRESEHLSREMMEKVDSRLASLLRAGHDPFVCGPERPETLRIGQTAISEGKASVVMLDELSERSFTVGLKLVDGRWKISDVMCGS